ncbi:MAG: MBOAT family O-acyltransferase [Gammaproteobacteria bacterium]
MVFSSATFLFYFFPAFLAAYYLLPWKNMVLLVASLLFYAWGEPRFVPLLLVSAALNYSVGRAIDAAAGRRYAWLCAGVAVNLALLAWYKYAGFLTESLNVLGAHLPVPHVVLPLGISFFTFQGISYLVDVYRGKVNAQQSFARFAMYKAMFPQLIAGPIVRYSDIAADIDHRSIDSARVLAGLYQFIIGLAQKVLVANTVALAADRVFAVPTGQLGAPAAWIGIVCYTLQILYDFMGYSNMAIGIGQMIGFQYPPNFNRPYSARSLTEFWRRWHISLSSWFRDYVYVPLGGNRVSAGRTYFNLVLVFFLCGLWHGAAWTFVIWGLWHGLFLIVERIGLQRRLDALPAVLAQAYTLLVVLLGWVWFRADSVPHALAYLRAMAGLQTVDPLAHPWQLDVGYSTLLAVVVGLALAVPRRAAAAPARKRPGWRATSATVLLLLSLASLASGTYNPFIYFRF